MHKTLVISFFIGDDHNPSGTFLSHLYIKWPNNDEYEANKETNPFTTLIINIHSPGDGEVRVREFSSLLKTISRKLSSIKGVDYKI